MILVKTVIRIKKTTLLIQIGEMESGLGNNDRIDEPTNACNELYNGFENILSPETNSGNCFRAITQMQPMAALPTMQQSRYNCQTMMEQCNNNANITYLHPMLPEFNTNTINSMATMTPKNELINIDAFHTDREVTSGEAIMYCIKIGKRTNVSSTIEVKSLSVVGCYSSYQLSVISYQI